MIEIKNLAALNTDITQDVLKTFRNKKVRLIVPFYQEEMITTVNRAGNDQIFYFFF